MAPIVPPSLYDGFAAKKVEPAPLAAGEQPRDGRRQHRDLRDGKRRLQPLAVPQKRRHDAQVADWRNETEERDCGEAQVVAVVRQRDPPPPCRGPGLLEEASHRQAPQLGQAFRRHVRRQGARDVKQKGAQRGGKAGFGGSIEPARVKTLDVLVVRFHVHIPSPLSKARAPASSMTAMTSRRTTFAGVRLSRRAPMREPSMTPRMDGTATSGSNAPRRM